MCSWTEENYYSGIITFHGPHSLTAVFSQRKTPGLPLGVGVWKGLRIGDREVTRVQPPILKCPDVLRIRQLRQYEPINAEVRERLELSLKVTNVIPNVLVLQKAVSLSPSCIFAWPPCYMGL